jgi:hypothetical protein
MVNPIGATAGLSGNGLAPVRESLEVVVSDLADLVVAIPIRDRRSTVAAIVRGLANQVRSLDEVARSHNEHRSPRRPARQLQARPETLEGRELQSIMTITVTNYPSMLPQAPQTDTLDGPALTIVMSPD